MTIIVCWLVTVLRGGGSTDCTQGSSSVSITGTGYISNYVAFMSGCGSSNHPWILRAGPGQRINITLIDNVMSPSRSESRNLPAGVPPILPHVDSHVCTVYAVIREPMGGQTRTICGGVGVQEAEVYLSLNNSVEIRVIGRKKTEEDDNNFLLMYQGKRTFSYSCIYMKVRESFHTHVPKWENVFLLMYIHESERKFSYSCTNVRESFLTHIPRWENVFLLMYQGERKFSYSCTKVRESFLTHIPRWEKVFLLMFQGERKFSY